MHVGIMGGIMIEVVAHSDAGIVKKTNQDSLSIKVLDTNRGPCYFGILCDGMGGLSQGELASTTCVRAFMNWFEVHYEDVLLNPDCFEMLHKQWEDLIQGLNAKIMQYGRENNISLGTTLLALLIANNRYYIVNVGDCRAYRIKNQVVQITRDHSVVGREVEQGLLTKEEAEKDSRRNILLQCVGASKVVVPDYFWGKVEENDAFLLCSDGFRHVLSEVEIAYALSAEHFEGIQKNQQKLVDCIELIKKRGERDNITACVAYCR